MKNLHATKKNRTTLTNNALQNWYMQRVTAVAMIISMIGIIVPCIFILLQTHDIFMVIQMSSEYLWIQIMKEIFIICACWHGFIGLHNVIMDYIKCTFKKIILNILLTMYLLGIIVYSFYAIWL
jgi:succinate dehydrogenase hydrophobic membrane anchor protein